MDNSMVLLTPDEVAATLRIEVDLLEELVDAHAIEAIRVGSHLRFTQEGLRAFLRSASTMPSTKPMDRRVNRYAQQAVDRDASLQGMPTADDFREALDTKFAAAAQRGLPSLTVRAGDLHAELGGYPSTRHRMPVCCAVMREKMTDGDRIVAAPPSGNGASLEIQYFLPRKACMISKPAVD